MTDKPQFTHNDYEINERDVVYASFFRLARYTLRHRLYQGGWSESVKRDVLERAPSVAILPYDPILDRVILIEQFRPGGLNDPKCPWLLEIPAGVMEKGEKPDAVAVRETREEAGCDIEVLHPICEYFVSPGLTNEYVHLYCGKVNAMNISGVHGLANEHEDIYVINISADEAFTKLYAGQIKTSPALVALFWLQLHRRQLQEVWR